MKIFKFSAMTLILILFFGACKKEARLLSESHQRKPISMNRLQQSNTKDANELQTAKGEAGNQLKAPLNDLGRISEALLENNKTDGGLANFIYNYGSPNWDLSYQIRDGVNKTTIVPTTKNGIVTGIIKSYEAYDNYFDLRFFSKSEIQSIIEEKIVYNPELLFSIGAVQSMLIVEALNAKGINQEYLEFIKKVDKSKLDELAELEIVCVGYWDCESISQSTGWTYIPGANGETTIGGDNPCIFIVTDCYTVGVPTFPNHGISHWGTGFDPNNPNNPNIPPDGTHGNDNIAVKNAKTAVVIDFMNKYGLDDSYFNELYDCVIIWLSPYGGIAESFIDSPCANSVLVSHLQVELGFDDDVVVCLLSSPDSNGFLELISDVSLFDKCNPEKSSNEILNSNLSNLCSNGSLMEAEFVAQIDDNPCIVTGVCAGSFEFVSTAYGITTEINTVSFARYDIPSNTYTTVTYVGNVCISLPSMNKNVAKRASAKAFGIAEKKMWVDYHASGYTLTGGVLKQRFLNYFRIALSSQAVVPPSAVAVAAGNCLGGVPSNPITYSILCF